MKRIVILILAIVGLCLILLGRAQAATVDLAWDASTDDQDSYQVFKRSDGEQYIYAEPAWSGSETLVTIRNLSIGVKYFFVVRAVKGALTSGDSNEVSLLVTDSSQQAPNCADLSVQVAHLKSLLEIFLSNYTSVVPDEPDTQFSGNVNTMIYHAPGCRYHNCAACSSSFSTRAEAEAAGYTAGSICKDY